MIQFLIFICLNISGLNKTNFVIYFYDFFSFATNYLIIDLFMFIYIKIYIYIIKYILWVVL